MPSFLTPARVAALSNAAVDIGAAVAAVAGVLPHNWQANAVIVAGLLSKSVVVFKWIGGASNHETALLYAPADSALALSLAPPVPFEAAVTPDSDTSHDQAVA